MKISVKLINFSKIVISLELSALLLDSYQSGTALSLRQSKALTMFCLNFFQICWPQLKQSKAFRLGIFFFTDLFHGYKIWQVYYNRQVMLTPP